MKTTLYLLMGLPGSGKTTTAKILEELTGATRLTSDEERLRLWPQPTYGSKEHTALYEHLNQKTLQLLKNNISVIYDANLNRHVHRQEKYNLAASLKVAYVLLWIQTPTETARERRVEDTGHHHLVPSHETPGDMFDRVASVFEPPLNEDHVKLDGTKISSEYLQSQLHLK